MIDRKALRESLSVDDIIHLMSLLGADEFEDRGNYLQFKTICHNVDTDDAGFNLSYYKDSYRFFCFSNCHSMDIFELIKKRWTITEEKTDLHFDNIAYWVMNHSNASIDACKVDFKNPINPNDYKNHTTEIILPEKQSCVLDSFTDYRPVEWLNDGISEEAMSEYNIKYSSSRNAIIIPHYDINGRLIGIRRRALNPEEIEKGKYKPIFIEGVSYSHPLSFNLYGLNKVKDEIKRRGKVVIAEGEKAALQGYTKWGEHNIVVSACGNKINRWQVLLLMKYCRPSEIVIAFDQGLEREYIEKLCIRYSPYCNFSYIYDSTGKLLGPKESPLDRLDTFDELWKRRKKVNEY